MGVEIKLSDRELPASPAFIDFIAHLLDGREFGAHQWADQRSEALDHTQRDVHRRATESAARVMADERGRTIISRAYGLLLALMTGQPAPLHELQRRFHFVNVIGIPRTGGSYLTAELFSALGRDPVAVPNALAHDGFPEAGPFELAAGSNSWILSLQTMAEYLTMVEIYFGNDRRHSGKIIVPKKLTKGIYAGGFFHRVLGEAVEHVVTLRHPVTACISTYEKSGGLPPNGRFTMRSNIEDWCRRDLLYTGCTLDELLRMDYFDAYLRYWEQYHYYIATTGLSANRDLRVVVYGKERMELLARQFHRRYDNESEPKPFAVSDEQRRRHPEWMARAQPAIERVAAVWTRFDIPFPVDAVMEAW